MTSQLSSSPNPSYLNVPNELTIQQHKEATWTIMKGWNLLYWFLLPKKNEPRWFICCFQNRKWNQKVWISTFFFHLALLFLIFIIVIRSNNLPAMATAMKSIVAILHFCCINVVVLLTNLHKKLKDGFPRFHSMMSGGVGRWWARNWHISLSQPCFHVSFMVESFFNDI